jgi:hypothetical protein
MVNAHTEGNRIVGKLTSNSAYCDFGLDEIADDSCRSDKNFPDSGGAVARGQEANV